MSLAYSGSMWATVPVPRVARCQARMNATNSATETAAARRERDVVITRLSSHRLLDFEALQVFLRLGRVESFAHHDERFRGGRSRCQSGFIHQLRSVGRQEQLLGDSGL